MDKDSCCTGINDSTDKMNRIVKFLAGMKHIARIELLPFYPVNHMGEGKYGSLGMKYRVKDIVPPSEEHIGRLKRLFEDMGLSIGKIDEQR